jgi:sulfur-oxidizing protein SoxX
MQFGLILVLLMFSIGVQSGDLPSDKQCQALWARQSSIKPEIEGWCLLIDRNKGNCLACHSVKLDSWPIGLSAPGNTGPELQGTSDLLTNQAALRRFIYDPSLQNPRTFMPLFGKHRILTNEEIDLITRFLMTIREHG